jgi:hypothetical protein
MNEDTLKRMAVVFMTTLLVIVVVLVYLVAQTWSEERFAETAFLTGISFVLVAEIVYFFERAFTPGEIWWTKGGDKVAMIGSSPSGEEGESFEEEPDSDATEEQ